ncbi:MAG: hypothetical protein HOK49_04765 [Opitutae bacterium]|nr:hypothetical protein [Opitutae bacterium]MBT5379816.1 hypothetical protein [Opitutae bacterium]MBT5691854.1 hypothetical protein [Opitutae bacterium]MBT6461835.1 hypothetical protein [Opitutae bacterium]MBT7853290.1 hypothetical protein [Opitutae bacterium]
MERHQCPPTVGWGYDALRLGPARASTVACPGMAPHMLGGSLRCTSLLITPGSGD